MREVNLVFGTHGYVVSVLTTGIRPYAALMPVVITSGDLEGTQFSFTITLTEDQQQEGIERVFVDDCGAIVRVEVGRGGGEDDSGRRGGSFKQQTKTIDPEVAPL
eukprot:COSAG06_NODE_3321_length_5508_cov_27.948234_3_plen_105_part_00